MLSLQISIDNKPNSETTIQMNRLKTILQQQPDIHATFVIGQGIIQEARSQISRCSLFIDIQMWSIPPTDAKPCCHFGQFCKLINDIQIWSMFSTKTPKSVIGFRTWGNHSLHTHCIQWKHGYENHQHCCNNRVHPIVLLHLLYSNLDRTLQKISNKQCSKTLEPIDNLSSVAPQNISGMFVSKHVFIQQFV